MTKNKILTVDDNTINLKLLTRTLEKSGYDVLSAENGKDACQFALKNKPDLVLLDVMMPIMDGYKVCEWLKNNEETADIPVIFLTAKSDAIDKIKGLALGAVDYITKPFDSVEVIARVKTHLGLQNLRRQLIEKNAQLEKTYLQLREKNDKINKDIKAAGIVQRQLLPNNIKETGNLKISWKFVPSSHIAGDIFNIIYLDDTHAAIYIIDVSGHGVQAAMLAVLVHNFFRLRTINRTLSEKSKPEQSIQNLLEPALVAKALNENFPMEIFDAYFTCIYGVLNTETLEFKSINAGHPFPMVLHKDGSFEFIEHADIPIGILPETPYQEISYNLSSEDKLILYTDGLYENIVKEGITLNKDVMAQLISNAGGDLQNKFESTIDKILQLGKSSEFEDDVSLFGIEIK
jgi:sigma-B regulation protein RsbU (phosphoserine phosphatase)